MLICFLGIKVYIPDTIQSCDVRKRTLARMQCRAKITGQDLSTVMLTVFNSNLTKAKYKKNITQNQCQVNKNVLITAASLMNIILSIYNM